MGDLKNPATPTSFSLLPGSGFYPSEEQLVCYYLSSKNDGSNYYGVDVIREINLYDFDPFDLPEIACFRFGRGGGRRHWFCYVGRVLRERERRRAGAGYWKKIGRVRDVVRGAAGKVVVGTRKSFEFYLGHSSKSAVKTDWVMYEYALSDQNKASFVLCRVFLRSRPVNNLLEYVAVSSCGDDSIATVHRCVGVHCDGTATSVIAESKMHGNNSYDNDNEDWKFSLGLDRDNQIIHQPAIEKKLNKKRGLEVGDMLMLTGLLKKNCSIIF